MVDVLDLPYEIKCKQGTICDSTEGLCIVLKWLAYPCRYSDLISIFGRPAPEISMISTAVSNPVIDFIFEHHGRRISEWNHTVLNHRALKTYAEAVSDKGAALDNCFGFVDGTNSLHFKIYIFRVIFSVCKLLTVNATELNSISC